MALAVNVLRFSLASELPTASVTLPKLKEKLSAFWQKWTAARPLQGIWDSILLAAPKNRRSHRVIRHRRRLQIISFLDKHRRPQFDKCEYCGSYKLPAHACVFCFNFLRRKANQNLAAATAKEEPKQ